MSRVVLLKIPLKGGRAWSRIHSFTEALWLLKTMQEVRLSLHERELRHTSIILDTIHLGALFLFVSDHQKQQPVHVAFLYLF